MPRLLSPLPQSRERVRTLAALAIACLSAPAHAQLKVLTTGAYRDMAERAIEASGIPAILTTDTAGGGLRRVRSGETFDLVINTPANIDALIAERRACAPRVDVARIGIGVAVAAGAPQPDISTEAAFRATILAAPSIAMIDPAAGGSSGVALFALFDRWGMMDAIRPKLVLVQGGRAAERVVAGQAAMALQQMTELNMPSVAVVGPLPAEVQSYTEYSAASTPRSTPNESPILLELMAAPNLAEAIRDMPIRSPSFTIEHRSSQPETMAACP